MMFVSIIVAMDLGGVIGNKEKIPWGKLPADMAWFRKQTRGKPVVMGRKTFESIGEALPERKNIVLSRNLSFAVPEHSVAHSVDEAISFAGPHTPELMIIGGEEIYEQFLPRANRMYITIVRGNFEGDRYFPAQNFSTGWRQVFFGYHVKDAKNPWRLKFQIFEKR